MIKFEKRKLKNGIRVLFEKRELPVVSVSITNNFGGAYEKSEIKGVAHLIEHLLFTGTKTRSHEDISREIEKKGGVLNAFTAHEATSYWFKLPSEHIFAGLDILIDMLKNPKFDKEKFEKEKKVILEEIKMYHDDPRANVFEQIEKNMFEKPFGELIIGNKKTVSGLDRDFVAELFKKVYSPENYIVTIVGNADLDKICEYLERSFEKGNVKNKIIKIVKKNSETEEERAGIDQAHLVFGVHAPLNSSEGRYVLEVLDAYLANGMSSKLFLEIREKRGLAYAVKSDVAGEKNYSFYLIYAGTTKEAVHEVKDLIIKGFNDVEKMNEKDLEEAKERLVGLRDVTSEESSGVMNGLMNEEMVGNAEDFYKYEEKVRKVGLGEVKKLAKELIKEYSSAIVMPK